MDTHLRTVKTSMSHAGDMYMLGCFCPIDDVELGITKFRARPLPPELPPLHHVPDSWYAAAMEHLPHGLLITNKAGELLAQNALSRFEANNEATGLLIQSCLEMGGASTTGSLEWSHAEHEAMFAGQLCRVWAWPLADVDGRIAISFRPMCKFNVDEHNEQGR